MKDIYARETKGYTKHPTLMDTEPTITKIDLALRIRVERERQFNRSRLNPGSRRTTEYLDSVKEEIHIRSGAPAYQCFEIGGLPAFPPINFIKRELLLERGTIQWIWAGTSKNSNDSSVRV